MNFIFVMLYVYNILLDSNNIRLLQETKKFLPKHFEMKNFSEAIFVIGIEIYQDRKRHFSWLSQTACIDKFLDRFRIKIAVDQQEPHI